MRTINEEELDALALGATLLGSGGGGDPKYDLIMAKQQLRSGGKMRITPLSSLKDEDLVIPVAFMGAPLVCIEKIPCGREIPALIRAIERDYSRPVNYLVAGEIGGGNGLVPLIAGAAMGIPVLDADTLGRAFPELQMSSCNLYGISPSPAYIANAHGEVQRLEPRDAADLESCLRSKTVEMGSSAAVAIYPMSGAEAKRALIGDTVSRAIELGRALNRSADLNHLIGQGDAELLYSGTIVDIDQAINGGFLRGTLRMRGADGEWSVCFQNEYLAVYNGDGIRMAATPTIIIPLDSERGTPVMSSSIAYGQRIDLLTLPSPALWMTPQGMRMVGPDYFGYSEEEER